MFAPHAPPATPLGKLRILSPNAAIRVSPLVLGAMSFGTAWSDFMGPVEKSTAFEIMDFFYESGGNFIDTANNYQDGQSEEWIGEWMTQRSNRDEMVIATKYTTCYNTHEKKGIHVNFSGNHSKSLKLSVEASLKKLKTNYIDLLYVHWWDHTTSIPELMQSLNHLVSSGVVLYLGISDTPAWIVSKANQYAADHGLRGFSVYQGLYNASTRDMEREILPMCRNEGLGVCPWSAIGGGNYKSAKQRSEMEKSGEGRKGLRGGPSPDDIAVTDVLERIAQGKGKSITAIALAYVLQIQPYVFPMIGGRKVSHLKDNIEALSVTLSDDEIDEIKGAINFELGFPLNFVGERAGEMFLMKCAGEVQFVDEQRAIRPS